LEMVRGTALVPTSRSFRLRCSFTLWWPNTGYMLESTPCVCISYQDTMHMRATWTSHGTCLCIMCITIPFTSLTLVCCIHTFCSFLGHVGGRRSKEVRCSAFRTSSSRNPTTFSSFRGPHLNPSEAYASSWANLMQGVLCSGRVCLYCGLNNTVCYVLSWVSMYDLLVWEKIIRLLYQCLSVRGPCSTIRLVMYTSIELHQLLWKWRLDEC
jgi:hypothetical protein